MRTWKGTTAGVLSIIGGIIGLAGGIALTVGLSFISGFLSFGALLAPIGPVLIVLGIIALIGGIFTLKRKSWGFCLAGAICAMFPIIPLGIIAIILLALARKEFN